jgi:hypothetical protein
MTSRTHPDYNVELDLARSDFQNIAGVALSVFAVFGKIQLRISCTLIIPEGINSPDISSMTGAWLWTEGCPDIPEGTPVNITVGEACDPMLTPEEHISLATYSGLCIEGIVTRKWDTEQS